MCNCKSSQSGRATTVKQVVKKVRPLSQSKVTSDKRTVSKKISYRRPI